MKQPIKNLFDFRNRSSSDVSSGPSGSETDHELTSDLTLKTLTRLVKLKDKLVLPITRKVERRKRAVSFADDKGLPLESVIVVDGDVQEADDNRRGDFEFGPWIMAFIQPIFDKKKMNRTFKQKGVFLETVDIEASRLSGTVKAIRTSSSQIVFVRYTTDHWRTFSDVTASRVPDNMDRSRQDVSSYTFELDLPESVLQAQFAVCLLEDGKYSWDKNDGDNYMMLHISCLEELEASEQATRAEDDNTKL